MFLGTHEFCLSTPSSAGIGSEGFSVAEVAEPMPSAHLLLSSTPVVERGSGRKGSHRPRVRAQSIRAHGPVAIAALSAPDVRRRRWERGSARLIAPGKRSSIRAMMKRMRPPATTAPPVAACAARFFVVRVTQRMRTHCLDARAPGAQPHQCIDSASACASATPTHPGVAASVAAYRPSRREHKEYEERGIRGTRGRI